ncbi:Creatinase/Prolidase N-terminal domain-containing protein [Halobacillus dabanensis]|uniref:Creatinase/Prolidase N-terminal domain-containing protein n=1 Tax=Halobacillus dabanensis TaxID=240302 RepID=A0A1I3YHE1_HALDA|nr:Xaa-Pro peptidase family protein [Halobacillus dabanensis]SFK31205.1 Creatinase/Prolidase N-terminal domain-containing protein [Halobacillus dabanensis]
MKVCHRLNDLRKHMEENGILATVIMSPENQFYLSGFKALTYSRPIALFVERNKTRLIVPGLEEVHAKEVANVDEIHVYYEHPEKAAIGTNSEEFINKILTGYPKGSKIGADLAHSSAELILKMKDLGHEIADVGSKIIESRYIKDEDEIDLITEAGRLVSLAVNESLQVCRPGVTELEIDATGNNALFAETSRKHPNATLGLSGMSPSGSKRTVMPHIFSNTRKLEEGDLLIHTRQVSFNGYRAELERTVIIGEPTKQQKQVFEVMRTAQQVALEFIKPGVTAAEVDKVARDVIDKEGFGEFAVHRVGHGIGISAHEKPYLRFDNDLILKEGMVFTIEPGVYIPGLGGFRHSDTVLLTSNGNKLVTDYSRGLESMALL